MKKIDDNLKKEIVDTLVSKADEHNRGWYRETLNNFWDDIIEGIKVKDNLRRGFRSLEVLDELKNRNLL